MRRFRGITKEQEFAPRMGVRDLRPFWMQVRDIISSRHGALITLGGMLILMAIFPSVADILFILGAALFWYSFFAMKMLPFKLPAFFHKLDKNDLKPGSNKPQQASGIYFFGNELNSEEQLWFSNTDMRTHVLMFGSTGSGKTEALVSTAYNALLQGSGFIYVDGKGDNSLFAKIFSMVRSMGREDDLLLINYMTGAEDIIGPQSRVLSNTMNPFAFGSSSMLSQLVISLMDSAGGATPGGNSDADMWKGRAIAFIEALMRPLVWLRDNGQLLLEAGVIRKYFVLDVIEELLYDRKVIDQNNNVTVMDKPIPFEVRDSLENYLSTLPGYKKSDKGKQSGKAYEQHGYITMQLTRIFGSLSDVYGHILRTQLAEVDFNDVVLNRRILVVLLPALEKSPDELSNLGKLIIASLRAMLASGLGSEVEGDYEDVIETKPTNSKTPYLCVLDEYGYYAVKGFAVVPAQARSLGFSVVFAGQDLPAFQKASKEEAASICANTNIKICMKLEDPQETWEFFQKTAGEAYVSVARTYQRQAGGMTGTLSYRDTLEASLDKRSRLDLLDLKDQREGEAHIFFKSKIVRAKTFYANPAPIKRIKVNQMLKVKKPSDETVSALRTLDIAKLDATALNREGVDEPLAPLFSELLNADNNTSLTRYIEAVNRFVAGTVEEEKMEFGDQAENPSIFMSIPVDQRLSSRFFDVEISTLQPAILTKEKVYELVKRLNILEGKSESLAKDESMAIINELEKQTSYQNCVPKRKGNVEQQIQQFINATK